MKASTIIVGGGLLLAVAALIGAAKATPPAVANITAVQPSTATSPVAGEIDINFTWQNIGTAAGSFAPKISIDGGAAIDLGVGTIIIAPGQTHNVVKELTGLTGVNPGTTHTVCPVPNEAVQ